MDVARSPGVQTSWLGPSFFPALCRYGESVNPSPQDMILAEEEKDKEGVKEAMEWEPST